MENLSTLKKVPKRPGWVCGAEHHQTKNHDVTVEVGIEINEAADLNLEVRFRNILLPPELWKGSLHQTTSNRLYNKQLNFLESLLAL